MQVRTQTSDVVNCMNACQYYIPIPCRQHVNNVKFCIYLTIDNKTIDFTTILFQLILNIMFYIISKISSKFTLILAPTVL